MSLEDLNIWFLDKVYRFGRKFLPLNFTFRKRKYVFQVVSFLTILNFITFIGLLFFCGRYHTWYNIVYECLAIGLYPIYMYCRYWSTERKAALLSSVFKSKFSANRIPNTRCLCSIVLLKIILCFGLVLIFFVIFILDSVKTHFAFAMGQLAVSFSMLYMHVQTTCVHLVFLYVLLSFYKLNLRLENILKNLTEDEFQVILRVEVSNLNYYAKVLRKITLIYQKNLSFLIHFNEFISLNMRIVIFLTFYSAMMLLKGGKDKEVRMCNVFSYSAMRNFELNFIDFVFVANIYQQIISQLTKTRQLISMQATNRLEEFDINIRNLLRQTVLYEYILKDTNNWMLGLSAPSLIKIGFLFIAVKIVFS